MIPDPTATPEPNGRAATPQFDELLALVDQHTLDTYIAVRAFKPRRVHLLYDHRMRGPFEILAGHLQHRPGVEVVGLPVEDETSLVELRRVLDALPPETHLHYTGGTGSLAAHAQLIFDRREGSIGSCLDEERRLLRFDDGSDVHLRELVHNDDVLLDDIVDLQGYRLVNVSRLRDTTDRGRRDALIVACSKLGEPLTEEEEQRLQTMIRAAKTKSSNDPWTKFLTGGWLEVLTATSVQRVEPDYELECGARLKRGDPTLELDVVAVGRFHPYILSCSTSSDGKVAHRKLFEVRDRTHRLAGAVGRPALVSLIDELSRPSRARLEQDLEFPFETAATPVIFDRSDVQSWLRTLRAERPNGTDSNDGFGRLRTWLRT